MEKKRNELTLKQKEQYIELYIGGETTSYAGIANYTQQKEINIRNKYEKNGGLYGWLADKICGNNNENNITLLKNLKGDDIIIEAEHIKSIYMDIKHRCKDKKLQNDFNDFMNFYRWYKNQPEKQVNGKTEKICHYCGTTESNLKKLFKISDNDKGKPLYSKKPSFTATLQVDRKDSYKGYNGDNCVLACALCNNAKSDMINYDNFKTYFKKSMQSFIEDLLSGKITNDIKGK